MTKRGRPEKRDAPPIEQLLAQAKMTNALLAVLALQYITQQDLVGRLKGTGVSLQEIADVLGTSYGSVAVASGRLRKQRSQETKHGDTQEQATPEADLREAGEGSEQ